MISDSLLIKYLAGEVSPSQETDILQWVKQNKKNQEYLQKLKSVYQEPPEDIDNSHRDEDWKKVEIALESLNNEKSPVKRTPLWWGIRAAAVILLALGTSFILNIQKNNLTIRGTSETPVAAILPDGSEVFLSKGSRLSYTKNFNQDLREVSISGEAFFSVTSDPERPFIVQTGEAKIRVTGTSFHVSAPVRNDDVEVVVRSGKVLFYNSETYSENSFKVGLGPGDKGIYSSRLNQLNKTHNKQYTQLSYN